MDEQVALAGVRSVHWHARRWLGLEHLQLEMGAEITADGLIVGDFEGAPIRLRYQIVCDQQWNVRRLRVEDLRAGGEKVELERRDGEWHDAPGTGLNGLTEAADVDIAATPFTNTLPIRRLGFAAPGESREIDVVYVSVFPTLTISPAQQRYTCLECSSDGGRYLYESLGTGFKAELTVDVDGLVIDYPGVWERVAADGG